MTKPSAALVAQLEALREDYAAVSAAVALIGKPAQNKAAAIGQAIADTEELLAAALAAEADAARKERLAIYSDVVVSVVYPRGSEDNILRASFTIEYVQETYNSSYRRNFPLPHKVTGFQMLSQDVLEYLIGCQPEAIPAEIMALAPGDARLAFKRYFLALRQRRLPDHLAPAQPLARAA